MINKINKIKNIASYKDYNGSNIKEFNRFNIIYGENGSGKTVLSKAISLCSEIEDVGIKTDIYDNLFSTNSIVDFKWNGASIKLKKDSLPREKVYVFNSLFVSNYLYDGNIANTKRFNTNDDVVTRIESPSITKLKKENENLIKEIGETDKEGLRKDILDLSLKIELVSKSIRNEWNKEDALKGKNLIQTEKNYSSKYREAKVIQQDIDRKLNELELLKRDDFSNDLAIIEGLQKKDLMSDIIEMYNDINTEISNIAKEKIVKKIQNHTNEKRIKNAVEWYEDGLALLISVNNNGDKKCPLCDSNINQSIETIICDYQGYFDESLKKLQLKLESHLKLIEEDRQKLINRDEITLNNMISKYKIAIGSDINEVEQFDTNDINKLLDRVVKDISNF